jgi:hypothetical protein
MVEQTKWLKAKAKLVLVSDQLENGPDVEYKPWKVSRAGVHQASLPSHSPLSPEFSWHVGFLAPEPHEGWV